MNKSARSITSLELILLAAAQVVSLFTEPRTGMSVRTMCVNESLTPTPHWLERHPSMARPDTSFLLGNVKNHGETALSSYEPARPPATRKCWRRSLLCCEASFVKGLGRICSYCRHRKGAKRMIHSIDLLHGNIPLPQVCPPVLQELAAGHRLLSPVTNSTKKWRHYSGGTPVLRCKP